MTKMLDILEAFLNYHGYVYMRLDGSTRVEMRQALMERFNNDSKYFIFILSTRYLITYSICMPFILDFLRIYMCIILSFIYVANHISENRYKNIIPRRTYTLKVENG